MKIIAACVAGVVIDRICGDPVWLYHPVRMIGHLISFLEKCVRKIAGDDQKKLLVGGAVLWILTVIISAAIPWGILKAAGFLHPAAAFVLEVFWCYQLLAARSLQKESGKVYDKLKEKDLPGARKAVSMIVGRDTQSLTEEGVAKAAVETVAENTSDGVIAPLLYMLIGGPILGFFYKAINTMDSMVGYKDVKYLYLGRAAAKLDDAANYIPARISGYLMVLAAYVLGMDGKNAWKIYRRDRKKHASPNAAQTEAACAGALDLQLAGDAWYFGKLYKKEYIGDPIRKITPEDIPAANRLMFGTEVLTLLIFGCLIGGLRILL